VRYVIYIYIYDVSRLRVNVRLTGVLRKIFGPKRFEVTAEWRKLHDE
jgi:hypothetical protein